MLDNANIFPMLTTMTCVICMGGASLLFLRGRNSRSRRILAVAMLSFGLVCVARIVEMFHGYKNMSFIRTDVAPASVLFWGNLYLIILLLYPLEVVRPGWLNMKRIGVLSLPYVAVAMSYYMVLSHLGQRPLKIYGMEQLMEHIGYFNVWYRLFMIISIIVYLVFLFRLTWKSKDYYLRWCRNNCSDDGNTDISWLRQYGIGVMLIGVTYFLLVFDASVYYFIAHNIIVQCFICYILYKGLFNDNTCTKSFSGLKQNDADASQEAESCEKQLFTDNAACFPGNENAFINKLPAYREEIVAWMENKKPYLNPDFKLMDVSEILPLNRTYLSRVFNEGFGSSFSDVVRDYRIRESEQMLASRKDIPVGRVGELCGFSSPSVFHRVFVQRHGGLTPNRYRKQLG